MEDKTNDQRVKAVVFDIYSIPYTHKPEGYGQQTDEEEQKFWETYMLPENAGPLPEGIPYHSQWPCSDVKYFAQDLLSSGREIVLFSNSPRSTSQRHFTSVTRIGLDLEYCKSADDFGPMNRIGSWKKMIATLPQELTIDLIIDYDNANLQAGLKAARSLGHDARGYRPELSRPFIWDGASGYYTGDFSGARDLLK